WSVSLELKFFKVNAGKLAGAPLDRLLDVVRRHIRVFGFEDRESETGISFGVVAPQPGGHRDFPNNFREGLTALGVYNAFVPLRGRPVTMAPHDRAPSLSRILAFMIKADCGTGYLRVSTSPQYMNTLALIRVAGYVPPVDLQWSGRLVCRWRCGDQ